MLNWLKGWKGIAVGAAFIALSLIYNSVFNSQIMNSILLQIPGYFLIGLGCAIVMYAALASSDPPKQEAASDETQDTASQEESSSEEDSI